MKRLALLCVAAIGIAVIGSRGTNAADEKPKDEGIQLGLFPSNLARHHYDPSDAAKSPILTLEIVNRSSRAIALPAGYDGKLLRLWGHSAENPFPLLLRRPTGQKEAETVRVAPGERRTCFSLRLSEILSHKDTDRRQEEKRKWHWDWKARPKAPPSPIHLLRDRGLVSTAVFWAEIVVDNQVLRTEPLILRVKSD